MSDKVTRKGPSEQQVATTMNAADAGVAADPATTAPAAIPVATGDGELSDADLDRVSGGTASEVRPQVRPLLVRSQ